MQLDILQSFGQRKHKLMRKLWRGAKSQIANAKSRHLDFQKWETNKKEQPHLNHNHPIINPTQRNIQFPNELKQKTANERTSCFSWFMRHSSRSALKSLHTHIGHFGLGSPFGANSGAAAGAAAGTAGGCCSSDDDEFPILCLWMDEPNRSEAKRIYEKSLAETSTRL